MHPFYEPNRKALSQNNNVWIGFLSMILYLVFWGIVSFVAARMFKKYSGLLDSGKDAPDSSYRIIRERYAKGEIDFETYTEMKDNLV